MFYLAIVVLILFFGFAEVAGAFLGLAILGVIGFIGFVALCHMS